MARQVFEEKTVAELQSQMSSGALRSEQLVGYYLQRIERLNLKGPKLRAVIEVNPDARKDAARLDNERKAGHVRGPLHGIPVLLKDNIDTADRMTTTAGSLALEGSIPERDSWVAAQLRKAGAVLLGKANLSEWANFRSTRSSSGWSARGGQCRNPYVLDRTPCGSSSGSAVAVAANMAALAVGTETDGSIICPSAKNGIVGIKPTLGLVPRSGIVPIAHSQDTAGPMARTVADAAILLSVLVGADPRDPAAQKLRRPQPQAYLKALNREALRGARIGVARSLMGKHERVDELMEQALEAMRKAGATVLDVKLEKPKGDDEMTVLLHEFKADLNAYLSLLPSHIKPRSLNDLIAFNRAHAGREMPFFGQEIFTMAEEKKGLTDPAYKQALRRNQRRARQSIDRALRKAKGGPVDAIVAPSGIAAWPIDLVNGDHSFGGTTSPAAVSGYPSLTVPMGFLSGLPVGVSFIGTKLSEVKLIALAYAYEQATRQRKPPRFHVTLPDAD